MPDTSSVVQDKKIIILLLNKIQTFWFPNRMLKDAELGSVRLFTRNCMKSWEHNGCAEALPFTLLSRHGKPRHMWTSYPHIVPPGDGGGGGWLAWTRDLATETTNKLTVGRVKLFVVTSIQMFTCYLDRFHSSLALGLKCEMPRQTSESMFSCVKKKKRSINRPPEQTQLAKW